MPAPTHGIDYELAPTLVVDQPDQLRAIANSLRSEILVLLGERAATTKELADALGRPPGTVGHHLQVLAEAGLVRVVRTRKVRAITAKYYGRTAATFLLHDMEAAADADAISAYVQDWADRVTREVRIEPDAGLVPQGTIRYARIPADRVEEWLERIAALGAEFATQPAEGDTVWGMSLQLFPTNRRSLEPDDR